jgi:uncharacterized protein with PQ loop repeat
MLRMSKEEQAIVPVIDFTIGFILCVVILISYLPQHVDCIRSRSAEGLSLGTILISSISCTFAFLATLSSDYDTIRSATSLPRDGGVTLITYVLHIANACMPCAQNLITIVAGTPIYAIYYFYFSSHRDYQNPSNGTSTKYRIEVIATAMTWLVATLAFSGSIGALHLFASNTPTVITLAKIWGAASAITNTVQWIPQIKATWTAQHEGILSIWSLISSVFSDILVAAYWVYGPGETFWVYMSNASDASLQIVLIGLICSFRCRRRRQIYFDGNYETPGPDDFSSPLLDTNETVRDNEPSGQGIDQALEI